ncbi:MAG: UbiA family prenyltransferase [Phycisphaerales bacterium]
MDGLFHKLSPLFHLTRVTMGFAAVANVWFIILWSRAMPEEFKRADPQVYAEQSLPVLLTGGAALALGLFTFAMALNDTLDVRRDRSLHPERPIPSGLISQESAVGVVAVTLMLAIVGAGMLGVPAVMLTILTAAAILFYYLMARYVPSVGFVALSLIYGSHMVAPNVRIVFVWPIWLVMTHAIVLYAVTHTLSKRRPRLTPTMVLSAATGYAFWSYVLFAVGHRRAGTIWPEWAPVASAVVPAVFAVVFISFAIYKAKTTTNRERTAEKLQRYGAFWLTLYAIGWMAGAGLRDEAMILGALAVAGLVGMTVLREIYGLIEHPVGFRR